MKPKLQFRQPTIQQIVTRTSDPCAFGNHDTAIEHDDAGRRR
jgi:hypothetical protein